jgi:hypothetical protein
VPNIVLEVSSNLNQFGRIFNSFYLIMSINLKLKVIGSRSLSEHNESGIVQEKAVPTGC